MGIYFRRSPVVGLVYPLLLLCTDLRSIVITYQMTVAAGCSRDVTMEGSHDYLAWCQYGCSPLYK